MSRSSQAMIPYLLLVSFFTPPIDSFDSAKIRLVNESPYHGVTVPLIGLFESRRPGHGDFDSAINLLKTSSRKNIWPAVFFNRFIGVRESAKAEHIASRDREYFATIKGMDIYDQSGALSDFYGIWDSALHVAKELGSPGIVVDPEEYNDRLTSTVSYLASLFRKTEEEVRQRLERIGAELTDRTDSSYPGATIWFLYSRLGKASEKTMFFGEKDFAVRHIVRGMLERAKEKGSKLILVSGGEVGLGYCYTSLEDLRQKIRRRNVSFESVLGSYGNIRLGGTTVVWNKAEMKTDWLLRGDCGKSSLKTIDDFEPLIKDLLNSYDYVWIYSGMAAPYDPYDEATAVVYNKVLERALAGSRPNLNRQ